MLDVFDEAVNDPFAAIEEAGPGLAAKGEEKSRRFWDVAGVVGWEAKGKSWRVEGHSVGMLGDEGDSGDEVNADSTSSESETVAFDVSAPDEVRSSGGIMRGDILETF